jgi:hypothetical protein
MVPKWAFYEHLIEELVQYVHTIQDMQDMVQLHHPSHALPLHTHHQGIPSTPLYLTQQLYSDMKRILPFLAEKRVLYADAFNGRWAAKNGYPLDSKLLENVRHCLYTAHHSLFLRIHQEFTSSTLMDRMQDMSNEEVFLFLTHYSCWNVSFRLFKV